MGRLAHEKEPDVTKRKSDAPFMANVEYSLAEMHQIRSLVEDCIKTANRGSQSIPAWLSDWTKELLPLMLLATHRGMPPSTIIKWNSRDGESIHIDGWIDGEPVQCVTAGANWRGGSKHWGKERSLMLEQLRQEGENEGFAPYRRTPDGIINDNTGPTSFQLAKAFMGGIKKSVSIKLPKDYGDCTLIIRVVDAEEAMDAPQFAAIAERALKRLDLRGFRAVHALDAGPGYWVQVR